MNAFRELMRVVSAPPSTRSAWWSWWSVPSWRARGSRWAPGRMAGGSYKLYRQALGRAILLKLSSFCVAGDIIRTVVVDPTFWTMSWCSA